MTYQVKALSLSGKGKRIFKHGDTVTERDFYYGHFEKLIKSCHIELKPVIEDVVLPALPPKPKLGSIRIAIVSAVWKRHEIFEMFAKGVKDLMCIEDLEIVTIIAGSEGKVAKKLVEKHGFIYIEIPNQPLAEKVNAPVQIAKKMNVDYCFCMGSDDIISVEAMKIYLSKMKEGFDFIGVTDFYFYDTVSKKSSYWGGYREGYRVGATCGAGRVLSARLLNKWDWKPWETKHNAVLDNSIDEKLKRSQASKCVFSLKKEGVLAVDVKSSTNMTPFRLWDNTTYIDSKLLTKKFPYLCAE